MAGLHPLAADPWASMEAATGIPSVVLRLLGAVVVAIVGYYLSGVVVRLLGRPVARRFRRPSLTRTVLRSVRGLVLGLTGIAVLALFGVGLGDITLSVAVFSAVLGIVLAPIVGSIISGLFVLADQPYEIGDLIELTDVGRRGYVEDITLRYTKIFTLDNTFLVLPNSTIRERDVINFSAEDERTRLSLPLVVTYESDVEAARRITERAALETPEVIDGGPDIRVGSARYPSGPTCYIDEYADHGVRLNLRYWVKTPYYIPRVRSKVNERVWDGIADADVEIAYPHSHLVVDETSGRLGVDLDGASRGGLDGPGSGGPGTGGAGADRTGVDGRGGDGPDSGAPDRDRPDGGRGTDASGPGEPP